MNAILDKNKIVKIDKWFIKLNPETEKVYAISDENSNAYETVLREDEDNYNVYTFTFDEEVLTYLADEELLNDRGLFCKDRYANKQTDSSPIKVISQVPTSIGVQMHVQVKYHKYGIYFTLKAKGYHQNVYNNYLRYWLQLDNCSYAQRCGSSISNYSHPWITPSTSTTNGGQDVLMTYKFYNGTKQLKSYEYKVRIRCESTYNATLTIPYYVIYSNYVGISDF